MKEVKTCEKDPLCLYQKHIILCLKLSVYVQKVLSHKDIMDIVYEYNLFWSTLIMKVHSSLENFEVICWGATVFLIKLIEM